MPPRKRKPTHGTVRAALEKTLTSNTALSGDRHAALVALCRVTADQVDAAGAEVSSRLIASYLSALKDLDKALGAAPPAPAKKSGGTSGDDGEGSALGALRGIKGGKAG